MRTIAVIFLFAVVSCMSLQAQMTTIDVNSTSGVWSAATSTVSGRTISGIGTSSISWDARSIASIEFGGNSAALSGIGPGTRFLMGSLTISNWAEPADSTTNATLDITASLAIPSGGGSVSQTFTYDFSYLEAWSISTDYVCANGGTIYSAPNTADCADRIRIVNPIASQMLTIGGVDYTLRLGFSADGGTKLLEEFWVVETSERKLGLYGEFTATVAPEPGFYGMLGLGLAGLYAAVRRRKTV